jgi:hypothetical protein
MCHRAARAGMDCWMSTMPELGIASAQALHLATLPGFTYPTDVESSRRWFHDDIIDPLLEIDRDGYLNIPAGPGTGGRWTGKNLSATQWRGRNRRPTQDPHHAAAVERGRAAVRKLQEQGIIDSQGRRVRKHLPADMQEGKDRDFGG